MAMRYSNPKQQFSPHLHPRAVIRRNPTNTNVTVNGGAITATKNWRRFEKVCRRD